MENYQTNVKGDYIDEIRNEFGYLKFKRIERSGGLYVTNSRNSDMSNDAKIFTETQVKKTLRGPLSLLVPSETKKKLSYFSQEEDKDDGVIYKPDGVQDVTPEEKYAIQNIGHATQLIQIPGFNILTDPIFNSLNWLLYPSKTECHISVEKLSKIDVILISHNHRDHVDTSSLKRLLKCHKQNLWLPPKVFVPLGDKKLIENIGYNEVEEVDWYTKIHVTKNIDGTERLVTFITVPADHRSGRNLYDHHKSLVTGWLINPVADNVIFKYSGDTRALSQEKQEAIDAVMWYEIKNKHINKELISNIGIEIPDIICFEPSGPNYTRCYMDITHQSASYSALLKFLEAENLAKCSGRNFEEFLDKIKTVMIHHNKFELGPDRFNEGLFVFKKLLVYLDWNQDLYAELERQKTKLRLNLDREKLKKNIPLTLRPLIATLPQRTSLLVHAKDFIIREMREVIDKSTQKEQIKEYLLKNTIFPKIGERVNNDQMGNIKHYADSIQKYRRKCEFCK